MITSANDNEILLSSISHTHIYYQTVHVLRTKASELLANVCPSKFLVTCLTETYLNYSCSTAFFPDTYRPCRADRMTFDTARGGGTLTSISDSVSGVIFRTDMELAEKCVLVLNLQ
jgi:hypothetical protein